MDRASVYAIRDAVPFLLPSSASFAPTARARAPGRRRRRRNPSPWTARWAEVWMRWGRDVPVRPAPEDAALLERLVGAALPVGDRAAPWPWCSASLRRSPRCAGRRGRSWQIDSSEPMIRNVCADTPVPQRARRLRRLDDDAGAQCNFATSSSATARLTCPIVRRLLRAGAGGAPRPEDGTLAMRVSPGLRWIDPLDTIFADLRGSREHRHLLGGCSPWRCMWTSQRRLPPGGHLGGLERRRPRPRASS